MNKLFYRAPVLLSLCFFFFIAQMFPLASHASDKEQIHSSIVKIIATHNHFDYASPWQRLGIHTVTGSGAIISDKRILTNAHVVADQTLVEVQSEGSGITYSANVDFVCHTCDLALLSVDDDNFFKGAKPLQIDGLPELQSRVNVYGFPTGGETISITEGIVSRIEVDFYVHSSERFLLAQVDAAINPGNSGGPAISNGKIIGIAMQALENAENIGYIEPAPVINHFLDDVKDGKFDGFPELDLYVQIMQNKALRESLKLPAQSGGLLVTGVAEQSNLAKIINPGDVILEIDNHKIDRDGKVTLKSGLRVESSHLEYLKQVGQQLELKILRNGKQEKLKFTLEPKKTRINHRQFDISPSYFVFAGFVFQPLSHGYMRAHHRSSYNLLSYVPQYTLEGYKKSVPDRIKTNREQIIVLGRVLPDAINQGYKDMESSVIYSVNNEPVKNLKHLATLIEKAEGKYLNLETDFGNRIILNLKQARKKNQVILQNYQVFNDRSPDIQ